MKKNPKWVIEVTRIGYGFAEFEVDAPTKTKARKIAMGLAMNHPYSEQEAEYKIVDCRREI